MQEPQTSKNNGLNKVYFSLLNQNSTQQYKNSLKSSSTMSTNILLEKAWQGNNENLDENTINNIIGSAKHLLKDSNSLTWKSSLSKMPDPLAIFQRSKLQCKKCTDLQNILHTDFFKTTCTCEKESPKVQSQQFNFKTSQNLSQESKEETKLIKPKFFNTRAKKVTHNKFVPIANKEHSISKEYTVNIDNIEVDKPKPISIHADVDMEYEEKAHKSQVAKITFKSAKEQLLASNPGARRTLGASRKAQAKFVSPMLGAVEKQESSEPAVSDESLKHIDPKMIELIESEIIDRGKPIGWDDIAGLHMAKSVIQEAVVWPLLRPDIFTGLRRPPRGILLFGPPGTGKTLIGKCVAAQCNATFFNISASSLTSKWIGDGEKMVRALFAVARCHQPAVIFIDEIDSLLTQRSDKEHESTRRIKTEFLVQFDGAATDEEDLLLIVGATNRPHELDEAARRRLVKRLYIPLPDSDARKQIISNLLMDENNDLNDHHITEIASLTEGYSGADMKSLCSEAAMGPIRSVPMSQIVTIDRNKVRPVTVMDFKAALQRVRPSVSQDDLGQYIKWNNTYGQGF